MNDDTWLHTLSFLCELPLDFSHFCVTDVSVRTVRYNATLQTVCKQFMRVIRCGKVSNQAMLTECHLLRLYFKELQKQRVLGSFVVLKPPSYGKYLVSPEAQPPRPLDVTFKVVVEHGSIIEALAHLRWRWAAYNNQSRRYNLRCASRLSPRQLASERKKAC
jgi:hypothetical protein